jgi:hypothetical protein
MSTDRTSDFSLLSEVNAFRAQLLKFDGVSTVSGPRIRTGDRGQYVSLGVAFEERVAHPDVKFQNELSTFLSHRFGGREDWWFSYDIPGCYGVINTYGLNPNPDGNVGSHTQ